MCYDVDRIEDRRKCKAYCMPARRKKAQLPEAYEQPYDSSFKALLDDQTLALLCFCLEEEVLFTTEVKESIFKREMVKPALRVDCAYIILSRKTREGPINKEILLIEFETAQNLEVGERMSEYRVLLGGKNKLRVERTLLGPFERASVPT